MEAFSPEMLTPQEVYEQNCDQNDKSDIKMVESEEEEVNIIDKQWKEKFEQKNEKEKTNYVQHKTKYELFKAKIVKIQLKVVIFAILSMILSILGPLLFYYCQRKVEDCAFEKIDREVEILIDNLTKIRQSNMT